MAGLLAPPAAVAAAPAAPSLGPNVCVLERNFDYAAWVERLDLGHETEGDARRRVYLATFARALAATLAANPAMRDPSTLSREEIGKATIDAFTEPLCGARGGRPILRQTPPVLKIVVFREQHADGTIHYHVAVKLSTPLGFATAKRALWVRHGLPSHWSCSHSQWFSAVRYGFMPSVRKPMSSLDATPFSWTHDGGLIDLFEDSQQPYCAAAWRGAREKREREAAESEEPVKFTRMDLQAVILSKGLQTKASIIAYAQAHGSAAMQSFVKQHQRRLKEHLEDAAEWASAPTAAAAELESDWDLLCRVAGEACPDGDACAYRQAVEELFRAHGHSVSRNALAGGLRAIIKHGPSKDVRVPFLIGTTNTGKSTLVESFDALFGESAVFHLPAITDAKYALRNWLKNKRFVFWDEYEPVTFAVAGAIPKAQFCKAFNGQLFEIQVTQNAHDGNVDFRWNRGAVFTAKSTELWDLKGDVTAEDVAHMKARCECYPCTGTIKRTPGGIKQCRYHLARWVRDGANAFDANLAFGAPAVQFGNAGVSASSQVAGLHELLEKCRIPGACAAALTTDVLSLGAVNVQKLSRDDWRALPSWAALREMERRRIQACVPL